MAITSPVTRPVIRLARWKQVTLVAVIVLVAAVAVFVRDIARIDQTSGGYEAPYTGVTGEPIDWLALEVTSTGFRDTGGIALNSSLDCTTGQIRFHVGPFTFDYRKLSERAIVVHRPQDACREIGFEPEWSEPTW